MRVVVIGAGRSGLYTSILLSDYFDVVVYEKEKYVGKKKGTDIVSTNILKFIKLKKKAIKNKIYGAIFKHKGKEILIKRKRIVALVLDHKGFEEYLLDLAEKRGVLVKFGYRFVKGSLTQLTFKEGSKVLTEVNWDILVGADGVNSLVARNYSFYKAQKVIFGYDFLVKGNFEKKYVILELNPEYFYWIVPENEEYARVGFLFENVKLHKILKKKFERKILVNYKVVNWIFRPIPIYDNYRWQKGKVYLIGDAAGMVKRLTGGGTIPSFWGANLLLKSILKKEPFDKVGRPLKMYLNYHNLLYDFIKHLSISTKFKILKYGKLFFEILGDMDTVWGRGPAWLGRRPGAPEVPGSNPGGPIVNQ